MDWDNFRIFLEVARARQLLAVARKLGINHATVARRLSRLEKDLHAKLVDRKTSGCELTPAGERLLEITERIETAALQAQSTVGNADLALSGTVRIGAPDGFGSYFLAPRLARLKRLHPALTIQLVPVPLNFSLPKREVDIAITLQLPSEGRLVARKLTDYSLGFYASRDYLDQAPPLETVEDLKNHTLITYVPDLLYSPALDYSEVVKGIDTYRLECASVIGQFEAIAAGSGVGILHDFMMPRHPGLVRVLPTIAFTRAYWLVCHADIHDLRRVREVEAFIVQEVQAARSMFVLAR
ncbi:MAG: LysR family transcriptional regulator [Telmatospirillum sp.]|nr:LysR family transcriptional regulator [Telmatospirillum sp.]